MPKHMIGPALTQGYIDKRKLLTAGGGTAADNSSDTVGQTIFTCNATGTTATAVGANAAPATATNVIRIGEKFKLFTAAGVLKEETVFRVLTCVVAGSTTVGFTPAAATAPVSGDVLKKVGDENLDDIDSMERRLLALSYTQATIDAMTVNDMLLAIRWIDDQAGI